MDQPISASTVFNLFRENLVLALGVLGGLGLLGVLVGAALAGGSEEAAEPTPDPTPVDVVAVEASCQAPNSKDSVGRKVTYEPKFVLDDDPETAWRCHGDGRGERIVLELAEDAQVVEVGLVPGYAKTDPADGTDRYAQNRRLTKVQWVFDDGDAVTQELDPAPDRRDLQTMEIDPVTTRKVALQIVESSDADYDRIAVSTIRVRAVATS